MPAIRHLFNYCSLHCSRGSKKKKVILSSDKTKEQYSKHAFLQQSELFRPTSHIVKNTLERAFIFPQNAIYKLKIKELQQQTQKALNLHFAREFILCSLFPISFYYCRFLSKRCIYHTPSPWNQISTIIVEKDKNVTKLNASLAICMLIEAVASCKRELF